MSKNLGNIPPQKNMTEEQQQTFSNGINKGRKLERKSEAEIIRKAVAYLKTTPAVTLVGKGGAYELLEAYAQKIEKGEIN